MNQLKTHSRLSAAYASLRKKLLDERTKDGHWIGQLSASALSTATAISTLSFYLESEVHSKTAFSTADIKQQIEKGLNWLAQRQNEDGGFGDTDKSHSNISTSMLVIAAIHAAGRTEDCTEMLEGVQQYVETKGGVEGIRRRYGKDKTFAVPILANCAMAGLVPWKEVSALPFEAACVPQRFYNLMQLPVVSYAIPALVAIGQVKFKHDPPWDPVRRTIRNASINPSLRVLDRMQPASGGFLEAVPLTSFVSMALIKSGRADHPVVQNGIRFIIDSFRQETDKDGSWPIDTNLATWNTTLSINALAQLPDQFASELTNESSVDSWEQCIDWVLQCQNTKVHPFTGAEPGGWGWSDLSGAVPDADDTPGAMLALRKIYDQLKSSCLPEIAEAKSAEILKAKDLGINWLIHLQNRDKGWPTFCRGWGKLPFDRSGTDITAHVIRGLLAWQSESKDPRIKKAIRSGFDYLRNSQQKDGSWLPLWFGNQDHALEENPCYGTAKVLMAYRDAKAFDTNEAIIGLRWVKQNQNRDGGWGGGESLNWQNQRLGISTVEETALCTEILLDSNDEEAQAAAQKGVEWLIEAIESDVINKSWPIGFYFAKLWYFEKLYPLIFATSALGRAMELETRNQSA